MLAGGGLLVGFNLLEKQNRKIKGDSSATILNAFILIGANSVTLMAKNPEIGQGVKTSLPMILAEELDFPWEKIKVEFAKLDPKYGPQFAGGSMSVTTNFDQLRLAGAFARQILIQSAAKFWKVDPKECITKEGFVLHQNKKLFYCDIPVQTEGIELQKDIKLKEVSSFSIIGKPTPQLDSDKIVAGEALFGIDREFPEMVYATVIKPDIFLSKVISFEAEKAKALPGVIDVLKITGMGNPTSLLDGVAIIAKDTWTAFKAQKLVEVKWEKPANFIKDMDDLYAELRAGTQTKGTIIRNDGDVDQEFHSRKVVHEATYMVPFIAHSPLEPMNFIANVQENSIQLIGPTQTPQSARILASQITGIAERKISLEFTRIGGSFGRRLLNDYVAEAVYLSQKIKKPVKLVWSRESDFKGSYFRPAGCYQLKAALDNDQNITAFQMKACTVSRGVFKKSRQAAHFREVFADQQPAGMVPNLKIEYKPLRSNVPVGALRTPGVNATTFAYQSFLDELAHRAKMDPIDFQLQVIGSANRDIPYDHHGGPTYNTQKLRKVIQLLREKVDWDKKLSANRHMGFAAQMVFGTYVAMAVEVTLLDGKIKVERIDTTIDCGLVINPLGAEAQIQGSILDALSAALYEEITLDNGKLVEQNFHSYQKLRIRNAPEIKVHFVRSTDHPQGLGEPAYPLLFPALCNAVFQASGIRVRELPLKNKVSLT